MFRALALVGKVHVLRSSFSDVDVMVVERDTLCARSRHAVSTCFIRAVENLSLSAQGSDVFCFVSQRAVWRKFICRGLGP